MSFELRGMEQMQRRFSRMGAPTPAVERALYQKAEEIITAAKLETPVGGPPYSPRDKTPGTLRASEHVATPEVSGTRVTVRLGAGGAASAYARRQHEELGWRHHVGKAKYVEDPFTRIAPTVPQAIADETARHLAEAAT